MRGIEQIPWLYDAGMALIERAGLGRWRAWLTGGVSAGRVLDEVRRVLKPGAVLRMLEHVRSTPPEPRHRGRRRSGGLRGRSGQLPGAGRHAPVRGAQATVVMVEIEGDAVDR